MKTFPAPGLISRGTLGSGRWKGFTIRIDDTWVGTGPLELPVSGRRIIVQTDVNVPVHTVFDTVAAAQENGLYAPDPNSRIILWFNAAGVETFVTSVAPPVSYWQLDGSGIYVPATTPIDFLATFDRLWLVVAAYDARFSGVTMQINVEEWTQAEGDRS